MTSTSRYGFERLPVIWGSPSWLARPPRAAAAVSRPIAARLCRCRCTAPLSAGPGRRSCGRLSNATARPGRSGSFILSCPGSRSGPGRSGTRRTITASAKPRFAATPPCFVIRRRRSARSIRCPDRPRRPLRDAEGQAVPRRDRLSRPPLPPAGRQEPIRWSRPSPLRRRPEPDGRRHQRGASGDEKPRRGPHRPLHHRVRLGLANTGRGRRQVRAGPRGAGGIRGEGLGNPVRKPRRWNLRAAFWFTWQDIPAASTPCDFCDSAGLLRLDGRPKPALRRFAQAARALTRPPGVCRASPCPAPLPSGSSPERGGRIPASSRVAGAIGVLRRRSPSRSTLLRHCSVNQITL